MPEQVRKYQPAPKRQVDNEVVEDFPVEQGETYEQARDRVGEIDDLIDEIDAVLEENSQEFAANYVQQGGE